MLQYFTYHNQVRLIYRNS